MRITKVHSSSDHIKEPSLQVSAGCKP